MVQTMRLYKCDACGKILMITAGERTVDRIFGLDLCRECADAALNIDLRDEYIHQILQKKEVRNDG